uniref:Uncharacterized protein n=1 Tax=Arundo donax TaxID=35708 RepID=A0A0A8YT80_ARUDO
MTPLQTHITFHYRNSIDTSTSKRQCHVDRLCS